MGCPSIFWCLLWFHALETCSFHRIGQSPIKLITKYYKFLRRLWIVLFSWFLSQSANCLYLEMLWLFIYWCCILLFCWKCFMRSMTFLVEFLGSFMSGILSSVSRDNLTTFFPTWIPCISFSYLTALARNFSTLLKGKSNLLESKIKPEILYHKPWFYSHI
jgi:uncharacterized membrane protein